MATEIHFSDLLTLPYNSPRGHRSVHRHSSTLSLTSVLYEGGLLKPRPSRFNSGKDAVPIVRKAGWGPGTVWTGAKNLASPPLEFELLTIKPIASRCTDWAIPAQSNKYLCFYKDVMTNIDTLWREREKWLTLGLVSQPTYVFLPHSLSWLVRNAQNKTELLHVTHSSVWK